ncbi:universal stress protein YxiE-like [Montipora capricornis]|uniref:universal stress protein YxiE-like n=1 Tax=Montipora capricornis TaxID=246305 RepID=UPI0035F18A61
MAQVNNTELLLIAVDECEHSERAFDWYLNHIHKDENSVIVLYCHEKLDPPPLLHAQHSEEWKQTTRDHEKKKDQVIEKYKEKCDTKKLKAKIRLEFGKAGETIHRVSHEENVNFIVMGGRQLSTLRRTLLGGVSDYVIKHSHIPVIFVPGHQ